MFYTRSQNVFDYCFMFKPQQLSHVILLVITSHKLADYKNSQPLSTITNQHANIVHSAVMDSSYWNWDRTFKDILACLIILANVLLIFAIIRFHHKIPVAMNWLNSIPLLFSLFCPLKLINAGFL